MSNISRREFLKGAGVAALAVAAAGALTGCNLPVQKVVINYYCEAEEKQAGEETLYVDVDATYVNTSTFKKVPAGYELQEVGDLTIRDGYVYAPVRKVAAQ